MPSTKSLVATAVVYLCAVFICISCKKTDHLLTPANSSSITQRFFQGSQTGSEAVSTISASIRRQDEEAHFLEDVVQMAGYPRWNKVKEVDKGRHTLMPGGRSGRTTGSSFYYIPFCKDSSTFISAVLIVKIAGSDTVFRMLYHWQYQNLPFTKQSDTAWAASDVFHLFTAFQRDIFGQTKFIIRDSRLLKPAYANRRGVIATIRPHGSADTLSLSIAGEDCDGYDYCYNPNGDGECPGGGCKKDCQYWIYEEWNCTDYTILPGTGSGGSSGTGNPTPGSPGNGSGGTGGGNWYDNPCRSIAAAGSNPCDGNGGGAPGWEPLTTAEPPYICTYQLTTHEQSVFTELDQEDEEGNAVHQGSSCQGTKRVGNVWFQGTKEHWLIQLDYLSKNPLSGEREFSIPNAGAAPGASGYVDLANVQNGNMFEIKPDNFAGAANGTQEINNYVAKANLFCTSTLPSGGVWNAGASYSPVILPTVLPNRYLQARLGNPGVILYSYITTTNPVPAPTVIPVSVLDKFRDLIDRLNGNWSNRDQIIAEFFQENPDVVTYIKTAAIGAGVAIIVGTIVEDLLTLGAGVLDDWACFVLAYRIVRFAIAL